MTDTSAPTYNPTDKELNDLFGDKTMRWYQIAARNATAALLEQGLLRILIKLPTGSGKTHTIASSLSDNRIRAALGVKDSRKLRVLFVAHKHRLLTQAEQVFVDCNNVDLITQSMFSDIPADVLKKGWDLCVLDECHREGCATFQYHLEKLGARCIIGLTATDSRNDGCLIKFQEIVEPISREDAVLEGWLAQTKVHTVVDVPSKTKTEVLTDVFTNFADQMGQTMVFVKTKKEVTDLTKVLVSLGYKAIGLLSQSDIELDNILNEFSDGKIQFILNCNRISEGIDVKGCTDVVLGRQIGSYTMLNQIIGRASRPDSPCNVWELINPLSGRNLDTTVIVGTPEYHRLISKERGTWVEREFDYVTKKSHTQLGIASGLRMGGRVR
jgi:superfamily II DNA or RNA helicase